jgi:hypothetical protein
VSPAGLCGGQISTDLCCDAMPKLVFDISGACTTYSEMKSLS